MNNLFSAILENDLDTVKIISASNQNNIVSDIDPQSGCHALMFAIMKEKDEIAEYLIDHANFDLNVRDVQGRTALMYAAAFSSTHVFDKLVLRGADITLLDYDNNNLLCYIAHFENRDSSDSVRVFRRLVELGLNLNHINSLQQTPFSIAVQKQSRVLAECILYNYSTMLDKSSEPMIRALIYSVVNDDQNRLGSLIKIGVHLNKAASNGDTALKTAALLKRASMIDALLAAGADPLYAGQNNICAMQISIEAGDLDSISKYVNHPDKARKQALIHLLNNHFKDKQDDRLIGLIRSMTASSNTGNNSLLNYVIRNHYNHILPIVLRFSDKSQLAEKGRTAAHVGAFFNNTCALEHMYQQGWNINQDDDFGIPPLGYACLRNLTAAEDYLHQVIYQPGAQQETRASIAPVCIQYRLDDTDIDMPPPLPPYSPFKLKI